MQVYPNRLSSQLQQSLANHYLVFGDEPQQKIDALDQIRHAARQQGFDERQSLLADNQFEWRELLDATQTMSLFASRQLIELELPSGKPGTEGAKILTELAQQPNADVLLVIHGAKIGKDVQNSKWFKTLDKNGVYVPCYPLEGKSLQQWITQHMRDHGFSPTPEQVSLVADFCEGNLLAARQEIDKLALLYPDRQLSMDAMQQAMVDQSRYNVFQLIDVLLSGDAQRSIKMLHRLENEGLEPTIVLWALVREWQTLQQLRQSLDQGQTINWAKLRIWKNRQSLYQQALHRLNGQHLKNLGEHLSNIDSRLKRSELTRPYVTLCHLCLMFMPMALETVPLE
ncbi:DNA polymerase III subunit delta [Aestuariibacter halophilus]|uniref:DNA polymerase III subunit delta n=1 Tax=Fluctibacter halophilus TaxID=226011 RepID=A0ABS8G7M5_9ALTE|nr:DNA polymerase III subunit delta [Aestuariibacter halophilus]MCC2615810.1 DNA polymerase III subunit delta [Aestuariibacter halophilus]